MIAVWLAEARKTLEGKSRGDGEDLVCGTHAINLSLSGPPHPANLFWAYFLYVTISYSLNIDLVHMDLTELLQGLSSPVSYPHQFHN